LTEQTTGGNITLFLSLTTTQPRLKKNLHGNQQLSNYQLEKRRRNTQKSLLYCCLFDININARQEAIYVSEQTAVLQLIRKDSDTTKKRKETNRKKERK
jgi:hypothetical protein